MTRTHPGSIFTTAVHSSRVLLKHPCSQSKEQGEPGPFSRSFTSVLHTANTSSTQSCITRLMSPEKWGSAPYLPRPEAGGEREMAEPVPSGEPLAQLRLRGMNHSLHAVRKELQRLRRHVVFTSIVRHSSDLKHAFYYRWLTRNWALGKSGGEGLHRGPEAEGEGGLLAGGGRRPSYSGGLYYIFCLGRSFDLAVSSIS